MVKNGQKWIYKPKIEVNGHINCPKMCLGPIVAVIVPWVVFYTTFKQKKMVKQKFFLLRP